MHGYPVRCGHLHHSGHRLQRPRLVVGAHHGDQRHAVAPFRQHLGHRFQLDDAVPPHRQETHLGAVAGGQKGGCLDHGVVFYCRDKHVGTRSVRLPRMEHAGDSEIVGLRSTRCEQHLDWLGSEGHGDQFSGCLQPRPGDPARAMH
jgi:hypothetical protein